MVSADKSGEVEGKLVKSVADLIEFVGEDPNREGLTKTPTRYIDAMKDMTAGYHQSLEEIVNGALFPLEPSSERNMVIVRDIQMYSLCEHHLLPFHGVVHIAYIPREKVLGLSKLARISQMFARRLQIQERLTEQIAKAVMTAVNPLGVGVVIHAEHMCMTMRGVEKPGSITTTSSLLGAFRDDARTRQEFLMLTAAQPPSH